MDSATRNGMQRPIFVATGGDSGSGKSTLTAGFYRIFPHNQITSVCLDDYHGDDHLLRLDLLRRTEGTAPLPGRARR